MAKWVVWKKIGYCGERQTLPTMKFEYLREYLFDRLIDDKKKGGRNVFVNSNQHITSMFTRARTGGSITSEDIIIGQT